MSKDTTKQYYKVILNKGIFQFINTFTKFKGNEQADGVYVNVSLQTTRAVRQITNFYLHHPDEFFVFVNILDGMIDSSFLNYSDMFCNSTMRNFLDVDNTAFNYYIPILFCFKKFMIDMEG